MDVKPGMIGRGKQGRGVLLRRAEGEVVAILETPTGGLDGRDDGRQRTRGGVGFEAVEQTVDIIVWIR